MMDDYTYQCHWLYGYLETRSTNGRDGGVQSSTFTSKGKQYVKIASVQTPPPLLPLRFFLRGGGFCTQAAYKLPYVRCLDCGNGSKRGEQEKQRGVGWGVKARERWFSPLSLLIFYLSLLWQRTELSERLKQSLRNQNLPKRSVSFSVV